MRGRTLRAFVCAVGVLLVVSGYSRAGQVQANPTPPGSVTTQSDQPPTHSALPDADTAKKTPADMYKEALHPLEVVRASVDNWSDSEVGALAVGMHQAGEDCAKLKAADYVGEDLYDLARLCTFGQDWNDANTAALDYVARRAEEHRTQAYALSVNALVHLNAIDLAVGTAREMLRQMPYDAEVAYALLGLKDFLERSSNPIATEVAAAEHPLIVMSLKQGVTLKAMHGDAVMGVGALYESAMEMAFFESYAGKKLQADSAAAEIEGSLPATALLSAEDQQRVSAVNTRFQLLGKHLPELKPIRSLQSPGAKTQIDPNFGRATVLVIFPDWCVGCRHMMKALTEFAAVNRNTPIHAYGLVFADDSVVLGQAAHEENFKQLRGTQALVTPAAIVANCGATDFPLGIVLDGAGRIRFIGAIPVTAFDGDSYIGKVIERMMQSAGEGLKVNPKAN